MDYKSGGGNAGAPGNNGGDGPRSTPASYGDKVWVYDSDMKLYCLSAKDGKTIWSVDVLKAHDGSNIKWKNASAPLIEGNLAIVYGGGKGRSFLAFDRDNGKLAWKSGDETATHATPIAATIHGVRQVIFFCTSGLVAVNPKTGKEIWRQKFPFKVSTAAAPVVAGDLVYCSAGYGVGSGLYRISKDGSKMKSTEVWRKSNEMFNHWSTPIHHDGHLYGMFSFKKYGEGPSSASSWNPGVQVEQRRLRPGQRHPFRKQIDRLVGRRRSGRGESQSGEVRRIGSQESDQRKMLEHSRSKQRNGLGPQYRGSGLPESQIRIRQTGWLYSSKLIRSTLSSVR